MQSAEFKNNMERIVESFRDMEKSLQKEREDAEKRFELRQTQILKAKKSLLSFQMRVEGIAGELMSEDMKLLDEPESSEH